MNVRVEYESTPIRHIAVQCPGCERWYDGREITRDKLQFEYQIPFAEFTCPYCGRIFGNDKLGRALQPDLHGEKINIRECWSAEEVYHGCLRRKEVWE